MKKALLFLAAAAVLAFASCDKTPEGPVVAPKILEFGFLAEDHGFLENDIVVSNPDELIQITLPIGLSSEVCKALVPNIVVDTVAAVVTINGEAYVSGQAAAYDFSEDVDILVSLKTVNTLYTVKVKAASAPAFAMVAEAPDSTSASPVMAISPVTGVPYVASYLTSEGGYYPIAYKFEGGSFTPAVGSKANFLSHRVNQMGISFTESGNLYAAFRDYKKGTTPALARTSIVRLDEDEARYVGDTASIVYPRSNPAVFGDVNNLFVAYSCGAADNGVAARALELAKWGGAMWEVAQSINGRTASDYAYYTKTVYGKDGKSYLFIYNQNVHTYSLYKYVGEGFETVFEGLKPTKADGTYTDKMTNLRDCECAVAADGTPYVLAGCQFVDDKYIAGVIKVTKTADGAIQQTLVGGALTDRDIDKDYTDNWSLDIDANGTPFFVFTDADDNLSVTWIDASTKAWAAPVQIAAKVENPTIAFAKDGTAYVVGVTAKGNTTIPQGRIVLFMAK
ncbi:MAG: hypothetical protein MJZ07_06820 [Bacteroidales bacterium]|nr:hypothetical protein [Bacteroidales bacterium]